MPAQPGAWKDPYRAYNFKLEMGVAEGHFTECDGLGVKVEVIKYREGGQGQIVHCIPGPVDYGEVTLRYGLTASTELWDWMNKVLAGTVDRRNASVVMLEADGSTEAMRWNLLNCWPSEWRAARLEAAGNEIAIESMTIVCEAVERA